MAKQQLSTLTFTSSLLIFLFSTIISQAESSLWAEQNNSQTTTVSSYIESSCNGTLYPDLCIRCLKRYFSNSTINGPQHLAHVALSVSLSRALKTRGYLLRVTKELRGIQNMKSNNKRVYLTVQDCVSQINDSVDQLSQAIKELRKMNRFSSSIIISDRVLWHISNVETWVSTALTDASTCVQSFPGHHRMSKRVAAIKVKAMNVAEVTSNALALFNRYASRYRQAAAARITKKP